MQKRESRLKSLMRRRSSANESRAALAVEYLDIFKSLCSKFREFDIKRNLELQPIDTALLTEVKADYKYRAEGLPQVMLMIYMNCFSFVELKEEFGRFILEFDDNFDGKLQHSELVRCLEMLSDESYLGRAKMRIALLEMGIEVDVGVSFLKEGSQRKALIDRQISGQLMELFIAKEEHKTERAAPKVKKLDYIDINYLMPYLAAFWLEYEVKKILKRYITYREIKGIPTKILKDGTTVYDPEGKPSGLFYALRLQIGHEVDLDELALSFRHVIKALESLRSFGFTSDFSYEAADRVLQEAKKYMEVDPISHIETRLFSINDLLPKLTLWVCKFSIQEKLKARFGKRLTASQLHFETTRQSIFSIWESFKHETLINRLDTVIGECDLVEVEDLSKMLGELLEEALPGLRSNLTNEICMKHLMLARSLSRDDSITAISRKAACDVEHLKAFELEYAEDLVLGLFTYLLDPQKFTETSAFPVKTGPLVLRVKSKSDYHHEDDSPTYGRKDSDDHPVNLTSAQVHGLQKLIKVKNRRDKQQSAPPPKSTYRTSRATFSTTRRIMYVQHDMIKMVHGPIIPNHGGRKKEKEPEGVFPDCDYVNSRYIKNLIQNSELSNDKRTKSVCERVAGMELSASHEEVCKVRTLVAISTSKNADPTQASRMIKQGYRETDTREEKASRMKPKLKLDSYLLEDSEEDEAKVLSTMDKRGKCCVGCGVF
mmetsp:Transcript_19268/g.35352  ORF Transcript_19268/g.35352 Transcript_19268/m.35352 type:complete len:716 (-) Transcript_19268:60-2207(-)